MLEFRAYRLTASGLTRLATLPALCALSCHGLDTCLDAATAACFATSRTLQQLHLGCDYEVPEEALQQLRAVAGGLSMCFRSDAELVRKGLKRGLGNQRGRVGSIGAGHCQLCQGALATMGCTARWMRPGRYLTLVCGLPQVD